MKLKMTGRSARNAASVSLTMRWLSTFALAMGVLLLPLAVSQDSVLGPGSYAFAGNGQGGPGGNPAGPGDGGGNAGSGKGGDKGNGGAKPDKGDLFGDMIYILRDENGVPITIELGPVDDKVDCAIPLGWNGTEWEALPLFGELLYDPTLDDPDLEANVPELCWADELAAEAMATRLQTRLRIKDMSKDCCDGDQDRDRIRDRDQIQDRLYLLLQMHQSAGGGPSWAPGLDAEDEAELGTCDLITLCANNTREVDLGRLSVLRAPDRVLDKARDEVIKVLNQNLDDPLAVTLDPSGRMTVAGATFDSPLVNLALYREFHKFWQLQDTNQVPNAFFIPGDNGGLFNGYFGDLYDAYMAMAFGIAAGSDKEGSGVDMDVVSRANAILHLPGNEYHVDKGGQNYEGFPDYHSVVIEDQEQLFINYSDFKNYVRSDVYPGYICYIDVTTMTEYQLSSIMDLAFPDGLGGYVDATGENITGFALAADDARRVLAAIHALGPLAVHWVDPVFTDSGRACAAE